MKTIKEQLVELGYDSNMFIPSEIDEAFMGIATTDWHFDRPVYDLSKIEPGITIPDTPEDAKEPIFVVVGDSLQDDTVVFDPQTLNKAIVGVTTEGQAVYEYDSLLEAMMEAESWDSEEAEDFISFNTLRDYSYRDRGPVVYRSVDYMLE